MKIAMAVLLLSASPAGGWPAMSSSAATPTRQRAPAPREPELIESFRELAGILHCLDVGDVVWGRLGSRRDDPLTGEAQRLVERLLVPGLSWIDFVLRPDGGRQQVLDALEDPDPKVRTLAAMFLLTHGGPRDVLLVLPLIEDHATTFPRRPMTHRRLGDALPELVDQTVAELIRGALANMVQHEVQGPTRMKKEESLAEWMRRLWSGGDDETSRGLWWVTRMQLATQGTVPAQLERRGVVQFFWDGVRHDDADLVRIALHDKFELEPFLGDRQAVYAARRLGRATLRSILEGKAVSRDIDLSPENDQGLGAHAEAFVARHAGQLFDRSDGPWLKELGHLIAAAELMPEQASELLRRPSPWMSRNRGLPTRMATMWKVRGREEAEWVIDRFFLGNRDGQHVFVDELTDRWAPNDRWLLGRILQDERFTSLTADTLSWTHHCLGRCWSSDGVQAAQLEMQMWNLRRAETPEARERAAEMVRRRYSEAVEAWGGDEE